MQVPNRYIDFDNCLICSHFVATSRIVAWVGSFLRFGELLPAGATRHFPVAGGPNSLGFRMNRDLLYFRLSLIWLAIVAAWILYVLLT